MRLSLVAAIALAWLFTASPASANQPAMCLHLANQLVHYDNMKQRAAQLNNPMWVARLEGQIQRVETNFAETCPELSASNQAAQQLRDLLVFAGRGALTFFTLGAY